MIHSPHDGLDIHRPLFTTWASPLVFHRLSLCLLGFFGSLGQAVSLRRPLEVLVKSVVSGWGDRGAMIQHALVYFVEFQWLVLVGADSLVITINEHEHSIKITNQIRSSYQHRLRRVQKLLRHTLRGTANKRWLQNLPRTLDELISDASVQDWTVRQAHPNHGHRQKGTPLSYASLTSTARYTKRGLYIPLFVAAVVLFPLATTLSTNHTMKNKKPLIASDRELESAKIVFASIIGVQILVFIAVINKLLSWHKT